MWNLRMLLLILLMTMHTLSIMYRDTAPETVRAFWTANVWLMALIIGMQAVTSHAAGSLILPWLAMLMHWLHSLGVAFWIGGVAALMLLLPVALIPYERLERRRALGVVMMRFSRLLTAAVALVIFTGIYNAANWFFSPSEVVTRYGGSLALKLLLVLLLLIIGALHHLTLRPVVAVQAEHVLSRVLPRKITLPLIRGYFAIVRRVETFTFTLRLEVVFAGITLALAALLSATPVPQPAFLQNDTPIPTATQTINAMTVTLSISPGGTGVNTYDIVVQQANRPLEGLLVELQVANPDLDKHSAWQTAEAVDAGLYVAADAAITTAGRWWTLLDVTAPDGTFTRLFFEWHITDDAAVFQFLPPSLLHGVGVIGILAAIGWLFLAPTKRLLKALHITRSGLAVAVLAFGMSSGVLGFAAWFLINQQIEYQAQLFPPPAIVNTVPPDAVSLQQGAVLFAENCNGWATAPDYQTFLLRLDDVRDEELYRVTSGGWRTLAPCSEALTDIDRWHIVNYIRTLRRTLSDGREGDD
jgi:putative copper export protein